MGLIVEVVIEKNVLRKRVILYNNQYLSLSKTVSIPANRRRELNVFWAEFLPLFREPKPLPKGKAKYN